MVHPPLTATFYAANRQDGCFGLGDASDEARQGGALVQPAFDPQQGGEGFVRPRQFAHDLFEGGPGRQRHAVFGRAAPFRAFHVAIPPVESLGRAVLPPRLLLLLLLRLGGLSLAFSAIPGFQFV